MIRVDARSSARFARRHVAGLMVSMVSNDADGRCADA